MLKRLIIALYRVAPGRLMNRVVNLFQPHFTVTVAAVAQDEKGRVLLLKHIFRGGTRWGLPGGFMERGEQPEAALRRELSEETGLEIENARLALVRTVSSLQQVQIIFRCEVVGEPKAKSFEIEKCAWFEIEEADKRLSRSQRAIIRKAIYQRV